MKSFPFRPELAVNRRRTELDMKQGWLRQTDDAAAALEDRRADREFLCQEAGAKSSRDETLGKLRALAAELP